MNIKSLAKATVYAGLFASAISEASVVAVTASFSIDPSAGAHQQFKNTTPKSGYCKKHPANCPPGVFSIDTNLRGTKSWRPDIDHGFGLQVGVPSGKRVITVSNGREVHDLIFRITAHSLLAGQMPGDSSLAFSMFQNSTFGWYPRGGCTGGGPGWGVIGGIENIWLYPEGTTVCNAIMKADVAERTVTYATSVGYEMSAPDPFAMHSGTYTGELTYSVGAGKDFDYFYTANFADTEVTFRFTLDVKHALKIDFPDASAGRTVNTELEPDGGWQAWQQGRMPPEVRRDVPFRLSLSGPVKVSMACGTPANGSCGISSGNDTIPLAVSMSIPGLINGRAVTMGQRMPIPISPAPALELNPGKNYLNAETGLVHISSPGPFSPATTYNGQITLVFDNDG